MAEESPSPRRWPQRIDGWHSASGLLAFSDGTQVLGTDANIAIPDARLKKSTNLLECHVSPDVLIPGKYRLRAGIFRTGILTYDYIENILTFEILGLEPHGDDGVCRVYLPYQWTIRHT